MDIVVVNVVVINSNPFVILNHPVVQEKKNRTNIRTNIIN